MKTHYNTRGDGVYHDYTDDEIHPENCQCAQCNTIRADIKGMEDDAIDFSIPAIILFSMLIGAVLFGFALVYSIVEVFKVIQHALF